MLLGGAVAAAGGTSPVALLGESARPPAYLHSARRHSERHTCARWTSTSSSPASPGVSLTACALVLGRASSVSKTPVCTPPSCPRRDGARKGHGSSDAHCSQGMVSFAQCPAPTWWATSSLTCACWGAAALVGISGQGRDASQVSHLNPKLHKHPARHQIRRAHVSASTSHHNEEGERARPLTGGCSRTRGQMSHARALHVAPPAQLNAVKPVRPPTVHRRLHSVVLPSCALQLKSTVVGRSRPAPASLRRGARTRWTARLRTVNTASFRFVRPRQRGVSPAALRGDPGQLV
jgi:hypothetical protein